MKQILPLVAGHLILACLSCNAGGERVSSASSVGAPIVPSATSSSEVLLTDRAPERRHAPVEVRVSGPDQIVGTNDITVHVIIDRTNSDSLSLRIALPPGAQIVSGASDEQIAEQSGHIERAIVLRLANGIPAEDVKVTVDSGGVDHGVHAAAAYRFGRPEPVLRQPPRTGSPVIINGKNLGTPIPLK